MKRFLFLPLLACVACGSDSPVAPAPVAPAPPVVPACQSGNTGTITFQNRSTSNTTYDVVFDGSRLVTIPPQQNSQPLTVAAGVAHTLTFLVTNTARIACVQSSPIVTQCNSVSYSCAF